jgi:hypothetical protein
MDTLIKRAKPNKLYFPILLMGDKQSVPHRFAQLFMTAGISEGGTGFTSPLPAHQA